MNETLEARIREGISRLLTHWRLFNLSLAGKCCVLFGLAVLLIIAVALSMPWYRMERLVEERIRGQARTISDAFMLFEVHAKPAGLDSVQVPRLGAERCRELFSPNPSRQYPQPTLIKLAGKSTTQPGHRDKFVKRAIRHLRENSNLADVFATQRDTEDRKVHRYMRAIRVHAQCLACHEQAVPAEQYKIGQLVAAVNLTLPIDPTDRQLLWNRAAIIAAVALATLCAIAAFYLVTHLIILGPVQQLRQATEQVTDGDLDVRVNIQTGDEFAHLSDAFNQMLSHLQESHQQLRTVNKSLDTKLAELAQANVDLYEANKLKGEFLANVSHELRTPLNSIIGFAELIAGNEKIKSDPKAYRYVQNMLTSGRSLLEIINSLLDLAKIEAGKIELHIEKLSLKDLCETLHNFIKPLADKKQLQLQLQIDEDLPMLASDAGKIQQILYNLLSNAIKFTPDGGKITLAAKNVPPDQVALEVTDTGPGISEERQEHIFEKFLQIDGSVSRRYSGVGLGLAIVKELTDMLGGKVDVSSQPGKGSTFTVTLPINAPTKTPRRLVPGLRK